MQLFHELITHEVTEEHFQQRNPTVDVEGLLESLRWRLKSFKETHNLKRGSNSIRPSSLYSCIFRIDFTFLYTTRLRPNLTMAWQDGPKGPSQDSRKGTRRNPTVTCAKCIIVWFNLQTWQNWGTSSLEVSCWQTCIGDLQRGREYLINAAPNLQTYHCFVTCGKT